MSACKHILSTGDIVHVCIWTFFVRVTLPGIIGYSISTAQSPKIRLVRGLVKFVLAVV